MGIPDGTVYFDKQPNLLDQLLVNKNMADQNAPIRVQADAVQIMLFDGTLTAGTYRSLLPVGRSASCSTAAQYLHKPA